MKKANPRGTGNSPSIDPDEILPEYNFKNARPNKFASRFATGGSVVVLQPDVATMFPDDEAVNEALRAIAGVVRRVGLSPAATALRRTRKAA